MNRKRVNLTLSEDVYSDLEVWAENQRRPVANLAAYLVELGVRTAKARGEIPPNNPATANQPAMNNHG